MPDQMEIEERITDYLDAYEISRLETMERAARVMDERDAKEVERGDEKAAARLG